MENIGVSIVNALNDAVRLMLTFIPRIIGFVVILVVGLIIATVVSKALTLILRKVGFDRMANRIGLTRFEQRMGIKMDPAEVLGKIVYWFIVLIFLIPAADALGVPAVSNILNELVAYIPNVFVAILVLFLGSLAATFVADIVRGTVATARVGNPNILANIARWAIIGFAALIALEQLQIAPALINELFGGVVLAVAIAFALAFGLGGQEAARRWLARGESSVTTAAAQINAHQIREDARNGQLQAEQAQAARLQQQAQAQAYQQQQAQAQAYQQSQQAAQQTYQQPLQAQPPVYQQPAPPQPVVPPQPYQQPAQPVVPPQPYQQPYVTPDEATDDVTRYNPRNPQ